MVKIIFKEAKVTFASKADNYSDLKDEISEKFNLHQSLFYLTSTNGKIVSKENFTNCHQIQLSLRTLGGKGGFGSMLRAIGAQIEKTTNREACRDLSGRRLRDINEEKRLKTWLENEKNKEKEDPDEKLKKKIGKLLAVPKKEMNDPEYDKARSNLHEDMSESLEQGLKNAVTVGLKRKTIDEVKKPVKKIKGALWIDEGISSGSDSDDSDIEEGESSSVACSSGSSK